MLAYVVNLIVNRLPQFTVLLTIKCELLTTLPIVILLKGHMEIWDKGFHSVFVHQQPPYIVGSGLPHVYLQISCMALTRVRLNLSVYTHIILARIQTYQICTDIQDLQ